MAGVASLQVSIGLDIAMLAGWPTLFGRLRQGSVRRYYCTLSPSTIRIRRRNGG